MLKLKTLQSLNHNIMASLKLQANIYIQMSKTNIDNFIYAHDYRKAFLLLMVLERIDEDEKVELIDYYKKFDSGGTHLDVKRTV